MSCYAALDVSQAMTAICIVDEAGQILLEKKVPTCPDAIADCLKISAPNLERVGLETGPLAVWLWNELAIRELPIVCIDARHANAALKMRPIKTDRNDAAGLAQIMRIGWFKQVRIKSREQLSNPLSSRSPRNARSHTGQNRERDPWSSAHLRRAIRQARRWL
ncbi:possible transposase [Aurantimonas manganoxydans SI85-9A1]|uniref:Possible transposase n=1 Tax=Aurantimonas manganoxydans (strain ATCC BAA-1229 / DSM 21871 / SI85-9A1) TaxID=287752 RepID=Q1YMN7_AURMS|nr:IS110 family transposase [Aurantimonas manganoxydans]EAS51344.1 possible transposase [Aurantimonas manganoxydans SI85-9A1]